MINKPNSATETYGRALAAQSYPGTYELPNVPDAFFRKWILRFSIVLPESGALEIAVKSIELSARREIEKALGEHIAKQPIVSASAIRLDDVHMVLEIGCPSPTAKMGDAAAIATSVILRGADERWKIEDIQGVPRHYWFIMK